MITVGDIFSINLLEEVQVKAGQHGLDREIKSVTIMDIPDIIDWLNGGELVIAGVLFEQCFSKELIDSFMAKGIAGVVTKEKFTSAIPLELFDYCDNVSFPVIVAPPHYHWGQMMSLIQNEILKMQYMTIQESQQVHFSLMRALIKGLSLSEICSDVYESSGHIVAIMDNDLYLMGYVNNFDWKEHTQNISLDTLQYSGIHSQTLDEDNVHIYSYTNKKLHDMQVKLLLYPVTLNSIKYGYVVLALQERITDLEPSEIVKIQQLGLILAFHSNKLMEISNATRRFMGLLLDQLLQESNLTQKRAETILAPTDKKIHTKYYAVQFLYEGLANIDSFVQQNNKLGRFQDMVERQVDHRDHILIFERTNSLIILIPYPTKGIDSLLLQLRTIFLTTTKQPHVYIGVSDPKPLSEVKDAVIQAEHTAAYLLSTKSEQPFSHYSGLGVLRFFLDNKGKLDEDFLRSIYDTYITPLVKYDSKHHTQLMETLEVYLSNNCCKTNTEKHLFIHKNTLRARLSTISNILQCEVDSTEDLFNIQLALKIRHFFDKC